MIENKPSKDIYDIDIILVKRIVNLIILPLTKLINVYIEEGIFPKVLKLTLLPQRRI